MCRKGNDASSGALGVSASMGVDQSRALYREIERKGTVSEEAEGGKTEVSPRAEASSHRLGLSVTQCHRQSSLSTTTINPALIHDLLSLSDKFRILSRKKTITFLGSKSGVTTMYALLLRAYDMLRFLKSW